MTSQQKRDQISMIILSCIDLLFGILSVVLTAMAIQVIAMLASGATLFKAAKIFIQSEKAAKLLKSAKPVIIKAAITVAPVVARKVIKGVRKIHNKEQKTMKQKLSKLATELKNNKVTATLVTVETLLGGGSAYGLIELFAYHNVFDKPLYNYLVCAAIVLVLYVLIAVATIYIGRDNANFALVRKAVKFLGGEKAVEVLEGAQSEVQAEREREAALEAAKAEQQRLDDEIYAKIQAEKEEKARIEREQAEERARIEREREIAAYKAAHPELFVKPVEEVPAEAEQVKIVFKK